jgi:hypothetical protein
MKRWRGPHRQKVPLASRGNAGHAAAFFGALLARVGATLAVLGFMLATLRSTGIADVGAHAANIVHELRSPTHEGGGGPADGGAIPVQPDALNHCCHIVFAETGISAMLTFLGASETCFNAALVFLMGHRWFL